MRNQSYVCVSHFLSLSVHLKRCTLLDTSTRYIRPFAMPTVREREVDTVRELFSGLSISK